VSFSCRRFSAVVVVWRVHWKSVVFAAITSRDTELTGLLFSFACFADDDPFRVSKHPLAGIGDYGDGLSRSYSIGMPFSKSVLLSRLLDFTTNFAGGEEYDDEAYRHLLEALPAPEEYGLQGMRCGEIS
jgi:hypothetical protein